MASKTILLLEDDLVGGEATESFHFVIDGKGYVLDLNDKNAAKFRKALAPFVSAARRESGPSPRAPAKSAGREDVSEIRAWAKANGYPVSERGRIARDIQEAYDAA